MVNSQLITVNKIIEDDRFFNIPIYQRLYVWQREQVVTMLSDLWEACKADQPIYYLGGTLVIGRPIGHNGNKVPVFDLIDGQQRFTTLWLIAITWGKALTDYRFSEFENGIQHRISFAIRPQVKEFFEAEMEGKTINGRETTGLQDRLEDIRAFINERRMDDNEVDLERFTKYIRNNVALVLTEVPEHTDLNKLFEVINNRGQQLQHHEILKAKLLAHINSEEREVYSQIWDACAYMNDYVEKNIRQATGINVIELFHEKDSRRDLELLWESNKVIRMLRKKIHENDSEELTLGQILRGEVVEDAVRKAASDDEDYQSDRVRSIVTFSMFLQHVLRIFLAHRELDDVQRILDKDLISIFEKAWPDKKRDEASVKYFISLLWELRYFFDKYVIKWVETDDGEVHGIHRLRINKSKGRSYLVRESNESHVGLALLQSMLYHSQQMTTHYWLTPFLSYVYEIGGEKADVYLRYLDNHLLCSGSEEPLVQRSWRFVQNPWFSSAELDVTDELESAKGTGFSHYWFYKLEYILWYQYKDSERAAWRNFRMRARNSVEHISPQTPETFDSNQVSDEVRDCFGNLALVSRSINSEYSNKPYAEKRARFNEKNREQIDSLKMDLIYRNKQWSDGLSLEHLNAMIESYRSYFSSTEKDAKRVKGG